MFSAAECLEGGEAITGAGLPRRESMVTERSAPLSAAQGVRGRCGGGSCLDRSGVSLIDAAADVSTAVLEFLVRAGAAGVTTSSGDHDGLARGTLAGDGGAEGDWTLAWRRRSSLRM